MNKKIKVAFIYKQNCVFLTGSFFANAYYHFFMNALKRNNKIDVDYFPTGNSFDISTLKNNYDIILLSDNTPYGTPDEILGIKDSDIPVISRVNDPHWAKKEKSAQYHEKYKINYYFGYMHESYFHQFYPKQFKFRTIVYGLEPSLYQNLTPYNNRIKGRILNSGTIGNLKTHSRIINSIRNPASNSYKHYKLRTLCTKLPYIDYTPTLEHEYVNDKFPQLLSKYAASIAATTYFPTIRYWEIPAAGCLTFMEITDKNKGDYLGYEDGETAIFINENNYKKKFEEYLNDIDNPKWEQIATAGKNYALQELNNDKAVNSLVNLMKELL